ncbi:MAG TPA: LLM class flavin-dependent oxidoreductase [Rhodospirillaceae bacterium]|nr:LLM class flavin-dependent oxidoreductase [Rhodospirillaceae bacterium]HAT35130.1 LLM class flavin-dependent oxidoreductase [Rhodospirillaceae bacterium]
MDLGFFTMPIHPKDRDYAETLQEDRECTLLAEQLGYKEAFFGEHITDAAETITSSLVFIAWLLNETEKIKLGTGTINIPNHHPAKIAAEVSMVDNMAKGRFIMGISPGGLISDAEAMGNLERDRTAMLVEGINMILDIWANDPPYNLKGEFWNITTEKTQLPEIGQGTILKPYQKPHPPIVVTAVAPFSAGVTAAAERGWEPISANFLQPQWVASHWPKYVDGCNNAGRPADPKNWRVAKCICVADDMATAKRYATDPNGPYYQYFYSLFTKLKAVGRAELFKVDRNQADEDLNVEDIVEQLVIYGTPDKVTDELLQFRETVGDFGTLLYAAMDWKDKTLGKRSMELLATDVMPAVNTAIKGEGAVA